MTTTPPIAQPTTAAGQATTAGGAFLIYVTDDLKKYADATRFAVMAGHTLRRHDPSDPLPEPGAADGVLVDLDRPLLGAFDRGRKLAGLGKLARTVPVVAHGLRMTYQEANQLRRAGIKWYPTLRPTAVAALAARARPCPPAGDPSAETLTDLPALSVAGPSTVRIDTGRG